ncbi:MAG: hypothetical protein OXS29_16010 [bacterium]|nr:hypothetical protein [bacterium]MDE0288308.1 hypothetical protein [bacterium]MDE0437094.1 hypothetical protein [bacterium]
MSTQQPPDPNDIHNRLRQAWDTYQAIEQTRAEASAAVTTQLAAGRAAGISMYRMAKWLNISEQAVQSRLQTHDQTTITTPAPSPPRSR